MKIKIIIFISLVLTAGCAILLMVTAGNNALYKAASPHNSKIQSLKYEEDTIYALNLLKELGETEVKVVFTSDEDLNCGAVTSRTKTGGCYRHSSPDTIYVSPGLNKTVLKYLIYHEYAHLLHDRNNEKGGECAADAQALEWGATIAYSSYTECELIDNYGVDRNFSGSEKFKKN